MKRQQFKLLPANGFVWNKHDLVQFCVANQGQEICISTNNEGVCLESAGIYQLLDCFEFEHVVIQTTNALEQHSKYQISIKNPQKFFKITEQGLSLIHI